jgi:Ca2+-binding RTX toxin-like protein
MQDQILDIDGGYGRKLLVDFEQATFNNWDEEIDISHRVDFWNNGDDTGFELKGSFLDDTFVFDQEKFTYLVNQNVNEINIRDGAGNDTNIILSKQLSVHIDLDIGDDYVYLGEELDAAAPLLEDNWYKVNLKTHDSSRFDIEQVFVVVDDQYRVAKDGSGKWLLANATDANAQEALLITDVLTTGSDLGSNLIVGIDRVRFLDGELRTGVTETLYTEEDNGVTFVEIKLEGSAFGERLSFKINDDSSVMDVSYRLHGNAGNDTLIGAMNGDRLSGGLGNDLLIGAGNGDSASEWRNFDRAEYDVSTWARLAVEGVRVGYDETSHTILLDVNGDILFNPNSAQLTGTDYQLTSAYQVNDLVSSDQGGLGSDILIGIERISIDNSTINLGVTTQLHDWDNDGNIDNAEVRGSDFNDSILSVLEGGDVEDATFLARSNNIRAEGGDDNVYAGAGGDHIRLGTGNDFVDGGSNEGSNNWGGDNQDEVRFSSNQSNYIVNSTVFAGEAEDILDLGNNLVFKILSDGQILRINGKGESTTLAQIELGDRYTTVQDQIPSGDLGGEGTNLLIGIENINFEDAHLRLEVNEGQHLDEDGNIQHAWLEGTSLDDILIGHDYNEDIRGFAGNDLLYGGAGGDRLNGGAGNDILIGGSNGTSGDNWRDLDQAEYWQYSTADATITKIQVGLGADGQSLLLDGGNEVILDPTATQLGDSYASISAFQISGSAGFGTDILVGIERLSFKDQRIDLLITSQEDDWNQDGIIDWSNISGTDMNDIIGNAAHGGGLENFLLNANNHIDAKGGDDNIWAMAGGDDIRPGGGDDYINGGGNGTNDGSGYIRKDGVNFSGAESRYDINSFTFQGDAVDIKDINNTVVFKVLSDGSIMRQDSSGNHTLLDKLASGQTITQVTDLMPGGVLGGEGVNLMVNVEHLNFDGSWVGLEVDRNLQYNSQGNLTNSWINGTAIGDIDLTGTIIGDSINGNAGDDTLIGLQGNDYFTGGAGDDIIWGDLQHSDLILPGQDVARFEGLQEQFTISRVETTVDGKQYQAIQVKDMLEANIGGTGTDTLYGIEALSFNDNWVRVGVDIHEQKDSNGNVIERHYNGSQFDDVITGSDLSDHLNGGAGNDHLKGGAGGDRFEGGEGSDTIDGGGEGIDAWGNARVDSAHFTGKWSDYTIQHYNSVGNASSRFDAEGSVTVQVKTDENDGDIDTLNGIERLEFSDRSISFSRADKFNDENGDGIADWAEIHGTTEADTLDGSDLNDVIYGDDGNDIISGGKGDDILSGDGGSNTIDGGNGNDVFGNSYVDTAKFIGNYADYSIANSGNTWTVSLTAGSDADTLTNIEVLQFSDMKLNLVTQVATRDFDKDGSIDFVHLTGTLGNNTFNITDTNFGDSDWALSTNADSIDYYLDLGAGDDIAVLGSGDDTVFDYLGTDSYDGGDGFDTLQLAGNRLDWGSFSDEVGGSRTISDSSGQNTKTLQNIEQVQFSDKMTVLTATITQLDTNADGNADTMLYAGTELSDNLSAIGDQANLSWILNGNTSDDRLTGGSANDRLNGGDGNDQLSGGAGIDTAVFSDLTKDATITQIKLTSNGAGLDEDSVNGTLDGFKVTVGSVSDLLLDMEVIEFADGLISLTKSEEVLSSFSLSTGLVDTRYVTGTQFDDTLNSSSYQDEMTGGAGNDTFVLAEANYKNVTVNDFKGLNDTGAAQDILQFDTTDDTSLFGISVASWFTADSDIVTGNSQLTDSDASNDVSAQALIDAANTTQADIVTTLLSVATFDTDTGNATFRFTGDNNLYLSNVSEDDLSVTNIDIV